MKARFLDKRNCHALLPMGHGLPMLQRLDNCLCEINDKQGKYRGLIDKLVEHNKGTFNKDRGSGRLLDTRIDIAQALYVQDKGINTQVRDRPYPGPAQLHTVVEYEGGTSWKTLVPLQYLLKGWGDANSGHQCYVHSISKNVPRVGTVDQMISRMKSDEDTYYYVGITGRNWLKRLGEHISETRRGNRRSFCRALRESTGWHDVLYTSSLREVNQSYEEAMNWEEAQVDNIASDHYGLNMIPGGFKGQRELHKLGLISKKRVSLEERERAIEKLARQSPLKGVPNPFMAECWKDPEHYGKVIGARDKSLSVEQVHRIRELKQEGWAVKDIVKQVGALNAPQVYGVLRGDTYNKPPYT